MPPMDQVEAMRKILTTNERLEKAKEAGRIYREKMMTGAPGLNLWDTPVRVDHGDAERFDYDAHLKFVNMYRADRENWHQQEAEAPDPNDRMCNWHPRTRFAICKVSKHRLRIILQDYEQVCFIGAYTITCLGGLVDISGATLGPTVDDKPGRTYTVYAPATHALPLIHGRTRLACVEVQSIDNQMQSLETISPMFRQLWNANLPSDGPAWVKWRDHVNCRSFAYIQKAADDKLKRPLQSHWTSHLGITTAIKKTSIDRQEPPKILVCGARQSGLSTLCRILTNYLHTGGKINFDDHLHESQTATVMYLDLDPKSCEFTPPGFLSLIAVMTPLLGPPMTHPGFSSPSRNFRIIRAHAYAEDRIHEDAVHWLLCVKNLIQEYKLINMKWEVPLIINTPGWHKRNLEIMLELPAICKQNVVVYVSPSEWEPVGHPRFDRLAGGRFRHAARQAKSIYLKYEAHPRPSLSTRSADQLAQMQIQSYMHRKTSGWTHKPLTKYGPFSFTFAGPKRNLIGVGCYVRTLSPNEFLRWPMIKGRLAALVEIEEEKWVKVMHKISKPVKPEGIPFVAADELGLPDPLDPSWSHAVGMVIIDDVWPEGSTLSVHLPKAMELILGELLLKQEKTKQASLVLVVDQQFAPSFPEHEAELWKERREEKERKKWVEKMKAEGEWDSGDELLETL